MAQLFRILATIDQYQSSAQRPFARRSDAPRGVESPTGDLDLARSTRTNVLVVGDDDIVARLMTCLWPSLATPMVLRHRGERLRLSETSPPAATVVIYDVDTLAGHEQHALYDWITRNDGTQVVSTAAKSLRPLLQAGEFDEALYYRLNVVMVDRTSAVSPRSPVF